MVGCFLHSSQSFCLEEALWDKLASCTLAEEAFYMVHLISSKTDKNLQFGIALVEWEYIFSFHKQTYLTVRGSVSSLHLFTAFLLLRRNVLVASNRSWRNLVILFLFLRRKVGLVSKYVWSISLNAFS